MTAIADPYAVVGIAAVFVPFVAGSDPVWVGVGAISLDLIIAQVASSLIRARLGARTWRAIHWVAYLSWPLAVLHSFTSGTDAGSIWLFAIGIVCVAAVGGSIVWRLAAPVGKYLEPRMVSP